MLNPFPNPRVRIAFKQMDIKSQTKEALVGVLAEWGHPAYRADQVLRWIYSQHATSWEVMTNIPAALREKLASEFTLTTLGFVRLQGAADTTRKFLWRLKDQSFIESVLIPANPALDGDKSDRHTLCISTQVGCAYGCRFCASGLDGFKRNLEAAEIVDQVLAVERYIQANPPTTPEGTAVAPGEKIVSNLVIMGMGEPLANYDNLLTALKILNAPWGGGIGARKITISTSGLAPQIGKLADEPFQFQLAISLHGATNATREKIMPVNRKYPLEELVAACEYYQKQKGRMMTFEYILIAGVNDAVAEVAPLASLAKRLNAKVNLIPYNPVEGLPWQRPTEAVAEAFLNALLKRNVSATLRREKGGDIDAACGQLRLRTMKEANASKV